MKKTYDETYKKKKISKTANDVKHKINKDQNDFKQTLFC